MIKTLVSRLIGRSQAKLVKPEGWESDGKDKWVNQNTKFTVIRSDLTWYVHDKSGVRVESLIGRLGWIEPIRAMLYADSLYDPDD